VEPVRRQVVLSGASRRLPARGHRVPCRPTGPPRLAKNLVLGGLGVVIGPLQLPQCALQGMVDRLGCCAVRDIEFVSLAILRRPRSRSKPKVPMRLHRQARGRFGDFRNKTSGPRPDYSRFRPTATAFDIVRKFSHPPPFSESLEKFWAPSPSPIELGAAAFAGVALQPRIQP